MNKILIALAALALPTAVMAHPGHNQQRYEHHYDNHRNGIHFGIFVNPAPYRYTPSYNYGYYGPTWQSEYGYVGCSQYGQTGLLVDRYQRLVRNYEYINRSNVRCDVRY